MAARIRQAEPHDYAQISELLARYQIEADTSQRWRSLWDENPVVLEKNGPRYGWVIEDGTHIVGYLGSVPLRYWFRGKPIDTYTTHAWAVDEKYRSYSLPLVLKFISQKSDLLLNTTARREAGEIFEALKFNKIPVPEFQVATFWITSSSAFARALIVKKKLPQALFPVLRAAAKVRSMASSWRLRHDSQIEVRCFSEFHSEYQRLWHDELARSGDVLTADRSVEFLNWHWKKLIHDEKAFIFEATKQGKFLGYIVLFRQDNPDFGLTRLRIADLQIVPSAGEPEARVAVAQLVHAAFGLAKSTGVSILETVGHSNIMRDRLAQLRPLRRKLESWPFYYKAQSTFLAEPLKSVENWSANLYDGDSSL